MAPLAMLSPEMRLLMLVAQRDVDAERVLDAARAVRSWSSLVRLAERERACGALWRRLAPHTASLDVDGMGTLRRVALVEGFRGQRQRVRLASVLRTLHEAGIAVMLLKGAALAATVYPAFEDRAMSDLDVLVRPAEGLRAMEVLAASGWRHDGELFPMEMYAEHHHLPPLSDAQHGSVVIEPHVSLFPAESPFVLGVEELWRDARAIRIDGAEALVPSPAHLAVHAGAHLTWSHTLGSGAWRTLRDLRMLLEGGGLEWDALVASARAANAATCCYWPLVLGQATGVLAVPEDVLRALQPRVPTGLLSVLTRHFLLQLFSSDVHCPSARLRRALWVLAVQPTGGARPWSRNARFARFGADTPAQTRAQRASAWGSYLSSAVRGRAPVRG